MLGHDPKAFESFYKDAICVLVAEKRTEGGAAIIAAVTGIHRREGWATNARRAGRDRREGHVFTPDMATLIFDTDVLEDGKPIVGLERAMILVAACGQREWRVTAGRVGRATLASNG
ncbi:hypothetical protein ASE88_15960 [Sphingomonas sp. Leaf38]|nr:hypothetical protein ASE88_15960 [Sphingomonas sp. Leaf38]